MARPFGQSGYGNLKTKRVKAKAPKGKLRNERVGSKRFGQVYREEAAKGGSYHIYGSGKDQTRVFVPGGGMEAKAKPIGGARRTTREEMEKASRVGPRGQRVGTVNNPTEVAGKGATPRKGVRPNEKTIAELIAAARGKGNAPRKLLNASTPGGGGRYAEDDAKWPGRYKPYGGNRRSKNKRGARGQYRPT